MSLLSLYNSVAMGDWQREYLYKVTMTPPVLAAALLPTEIDMYINDIKMPGSKQKVIKKDFAGQWANFAGPLDNAGTTEMTFQVDEGGKIFAFLEAWHSLSGSDLTAAAFPKSSITGQIFVTLYKTDKDTPVQTVALMNAWIPEIGDLSLDKTKDGLLTVKVVVAYDSRSVTFV